MLTINQKPITGAAELHHIELEAVFLANLKKYLASAENADPDAKVAPIEVPTANSDQDFLALGTNKRWLTPAEVNILRQAVLDARNEFKDSHFAADTSDAHHVTDIIRSVGKNLCLANLDRGFPMATKEGAHLKSLNLPELQKRIAETQKHYLIYVTMAKLKGDYLASGWHAHLGKINQILNHMRKIMQDLSLAAKVKTGRLLYLMEHDYKKEISPNVLLKLVGKTDKKIEKIANDRTIDIYAYLLATSLAHIYEQLPELKHIDKNGFTMAKEKPYLASVFEISHASSSKSDPINAAK